MNEIKTYDRQTLIDVALQHSGCVEAAFAIAMLNECSITDELPEVLRIPATEATKAKTVLFFVNGDSIPATALETASEQNETDAVAQRCAAAVEEEKKNE